MKRHNDRLFIVLLFLLVAFFFVAFQIQQLRLIDVSYLGEELRTENIYVYIAFLALVPVGLFVLLWLPGIFVIKVSLRIPQTTCSLPQTVRIVSTNHSVFVTQPLSQTQLQVFRC